MVVTTYLEWLRENNWVIHVRWGNGEGEEE